MRTGLIVAHPGHELRVYGWLQQLSPTVLILTDGSGHSRGSRLEETTQLLQGVGLQPGNIYGRFTDRQLYAALLARDVQLFLDLAEELARTFVREQLAWVITDAAEGYNPAHDVCHLVAEAAVRLAEKLWAHRVAPFDFPLVKRPDDCPEPLRARARWLHLDDAAFARKQAAARAYGPLADEIVSLLEKVGEQAFRVECLRPVRQWSDTSDEWLTKPPFYEWYGEKQVAAGYYQNVIRYREHIKPLAEALWTLTR